MSNKNKSVKVGTEEILELAGKLVTGDRVIVEGFKDADGDVFDQTFEVLGSDAYIGMVRESRDILAKAEVSREWPSGGAEADAVEAAAFKELKASFDKTIADREGEERSEVVKGAAYEPVDGPLHKLRDNHYLLRLKIIGELPMGKVPKSEIPKAKRAITRILDLPVGRYVHVLKLDAEHCDGIRRA